MVAEDLAEAGEICRTTLFALLIVGETLKALGEVFSPTSELLDTSVFDFSKLEIPLNICGKASEEFQQKIKQSSSTSGSNDMRYWNEIKIMGDNVDHFQQLLCGFKMVFTIFLINEDR